MGGVGIVELTCGAIEGAGNDGSHAQRAVGVLDIQSKFVVEGSEQASGVANVLEFVQQAVDVAGHAARDVAVANAICKDHSGNVVAAGKNCREVSATIGAGRNGDDVGLETREFQRAMGFLVAGP
jgi:hypothetical protein